MDNELSVEALKVIVATVRDAMRNDGPTPQLGLLRLPEDDKFRAMVTDIIERQLVTFEKKVETIVHDEIVSTLRRVGIRIDDDHIDETAEDFRAMMKTHRNMNRLSTGLGITLLTGMFFGVLKLLGLNLPMGGEH